MLVIIENDLINEMAGLIGLLQAHEDNGSICDRSKPQAHRISERLQDMKRTPIENKIELLEAYREKRKYDGGEGRVWSACKHFDAEELIKRLENE